MQAVATRAASHDEPDGLWSCLKMPDPDSEILAPAEARQLVRAFEAARERARGRHAAPASWLPASGTRVATASWMAHCQAEEDGDWPTVRRAREDLVDLQAFVSDDEVVAAETRSRQAGRSAHGSPWDLDPIRWAQASVICMLREEDRVLGAYNALADIDVVIGEARRSLEAVDRYKETQVSGFAAMAYWPVGLLIGLVAGSLAGGVSVVAIVVVAGIGIAGYTLYLAPAFGMAVGTLSSRIDRLAMRANQRILLGIGRALATLSWLAAFFGVPIAIGLAVSIVSRRLGLP